MTRRQLLGFAVALALCAAAGCRPRASAPPAPPAVKPTPVPTPSPAPLSAELSGFEAVIPDGRGGRMALVRGAAVAIDSTSGNRSRGTIRGTSAVLYRRGHPVLELVAPVVEGDSKKGVITARGGVVARTIGGLQTTRLRSDTMTWRAGADRLEGRGNVLMTHGDAARVPGDTFRADTRLRRVELFFGDAPATGRL